jgi:hypothetical protein
MQRSTSSRRQDEGVTAPPARPLREKIAALREEMREVSEALRAVAQRDLAVSAIFGAGYGKAVQDLVPQRGRSARPQAARPGRRPLHLRPAGGADS